MCSTRCLHLLLACLALLTAFSVGQEVQIELVSSEDEDSPWPSAALQGGTAARTWLVRLDTAAAAAGLLQQLRNMGISVASDQVRRAAAHPACNELAVAYKRSRMLHKAGAGWHGASERPCRMKGPLPRGRAHPCCQPPSMHAPPPATATPIRGRQAVPSASAVAITAASDFDSAALGEALEELAGGAGSFQQLVSAWQLPLLSL